jgi:O-antigen biosynthesis protein
MPAEPRTYFTHLRHDLVDAVAPLRPSRALDVGCADGSTGILLKERYAGCHVTGIEPTQAADAAKEKLDRVFHGGVETFLHRFGPAEFDLVLLGDVLEHLVDPWAALASIAGCLAPGGVLVATVPNVRNWRVVRDLALRGRWEYASEGIMDRTHLRFFTASSVRGLVKDAGLRIDRVEFVVPRRAEIVNQATLRLFAGLLAQKHLVRAVR